MLVKEFIIKFWIELQGVYQWPPSMPPRKHAPEDIQRIVRIVGGGFHGGH
mgnify:CR=1 FL=1